MAKEYIKKEDAIKAICKASHKEEPPCRNQIVSCMWSGTKVREYAEEIYNIPPADVFPVELVAEMFGNDEPCNFTLFGVDIDGFMFSKCGDWCEKNCDTATPIECWKKFAEAIREWEGEQHG